MKTKFWLGFALAMLTATACTKKSSGGLDYGLDVKETLRVNLQAEPPSLDWHKSVDTTSSKIQFNIMDGLVDFNLTDPELPTIPALASSWKESDEGTTWTFTLRKDVKWTDGVPFTGQNVVDGWERLLNPATAAQYASYLFVVKNAKAYNSGKLKDFKEVGVHLNEQGDVVVNLEHAMGFFPMLLTHHCTFPLRKDLVTKFGEKWTDASNIQTLGAYRLKLWEHDKAIVLERNDAYYGDKAKIKNVIGYMINEFSTALNLMESGKLDFQEELPSNELPRLKAKSGFRQVNELTIYYYGFNTRKPPFDNVKVRRALSAAVDRKQITDLMAAGHQPLTGWIPNGMFGHDPDRGQKFDAALAAKLLDEAGYKDRSRFPRMTLGFNTNENHQRIAENVQAQLKKNLGIDVQLANEEWKTYLAHLRTSPPELYRMGWLADYPDPSTFVELMTGASENNHTGWRNKKFDDLVALGTGQLNKDERRKTYSELQKILTEDDVPVIPIYSGVRQIMLNDRVKDFPLTPISRYLFKGVSFK